MNNDHIYSLCVSVIGTQGKDMLFRVADINEHNELVPFCFNPMSPRDAENTNLIYSNPRETQVEGNIALWRWSVKDGYKQYSYVDSSISWFEYVRLNNISSAEELRIAFFDGIDIEFSPNHNYLIEYSRNDDNVYQCVLCKSSNFTLLADRYVLRRDIYGLERYDLSSSDIYEIRTNYLPKINKYYYRHLALPQMSGLLLVRTPSDTVKQAIIRRIQRCTEGFSKADKSIINNFVRNLSSESIIKHIADECRCTTEEAGEYIDEFVKTCERYFAEDDIASSALLRLVEYDSEIGRKYQKVVQDEWEKQNANRIAEAMREEKQITDRIDTERQKSNSEISEAKNKLNNLLSECKEYEKLRVDLEDKVNDLQKEYDSKLNIADDIVKKVHDKLTMAKSDLSSFFAEYTLFSENQSSVSVHTGSNNYIIVGNSISKEPESVLDVNELVECLKENLEAVGVDKLHCSALGAYLLAAYFARVPLIVAGYGADAIIDAVSATIYNKEADRYFVVAGSQILDRLSSGIVAVYNGFCNMDSILNSSKSSYVYFVSQTSEELMLEPRSVYNYALPLFTEYFISNSSKDELIGTISNVQYSRTSKSQKPYFPSYIVPPLAFNNYKMLLGMSGELFGGIRTYDINLLTTLPIMLSLNKRDELLELLSSSTLSDKDKEKIYVLIGEKL